MDGNKETLCFPDTRKTCFACCPPIRPAGYEHVLHAGMVKRTLRENTAAFDPEERTIRPITGFSCWALGYLDLEFRLVGCLLHPARHSGEDLRFRIDYGEKCRRETCPEARIFDRLEPDTRAFWLHLADDLDAFSYSSRTQNPLFHLLNWGPELLTMVAGDAPQAVHSAQSLPEAYPFFTSHLHPRAMAWPVARLILLKGTGLLRDPAFALRLAPFLAALADALRKEAGPYPDPPSAPPVHRLPEDPAFLDFLRLYVDIRRLTPERARTLKERADRNLSEFARRVLS